VSDGVEGQPPGEFRQLRIEVVYALPEQQYRQQLALPMGATVADALAAVADQCPFNHLNLDEHAVGVFGERASRSRELADHDRVEIYRPLVMDPVEARRRRAQASSRIPSGTSGSVIDVGSKSPEK